MANNVTQKRVARCITLNSLLLVSSSTLINLAPSITVFCLTQDGLLEERILALSLILGSYILANVLFDTLSKKNEALFQLMSELEKSDVISNLFYHSYDFLQSPTTKQKTANMLFSLDNQSLLIRYYENVLALVSSGLSLTISFAVIYSVDPLAAFISLSMTAISAALNQAKINVLAKRTARLLRVNKGLNYFESLIKSPTFLEDNQIYGYAGLVSGKYAEYIENVNQSLGEKSTYVALLEGISACLSVSGFIIGAASLSLSAGNTDIALLSAAITTMYSFVRVVESTFSSCVQVTSVWTQLQSFRELKKIRRENELSKIATSEFAVQLKGVSYSYDGNRRIIDDLDLCVKRGETVAVVGENGCGKSTLIGLIAGVLTPQSGQIMKNNNLNYAYVQQKSVCFPESIKDNVILSHEYKIEKLSQSMDRVGLSSFVSELPRKENTLLNNQINETGVELSGGQFQRITISRGIYGDTDVLILDEPTASLDVINEEMIFAMIKQLRDVETKIFISHRLANCRYADIIYFLSDGKIVEVGSHEKLIAEKGAYYRLYCKQSALYTGKCSRSKLKDTL